MRFIKRIAAVVVLTVGSLEAAEPVHIFPDLAQPALIQLGGGGNIGDPITPELILSFLQSIQPDFIFEETGIILPDPTPITTEFLSSGKIPHVDADDYLVIYYGNRDQFTGGADVLFFPSAVDGFVIPPTFNVPDDGTFDFEIAFLYDHTAAPDGGLTLGLLGIGVAGVMLARRSVSKSR